MTLKALQCSKEEGKNGGKDAYIWSLFMTKLTLTAY